MSGTSTTTSIIISTSTKTKFLGLVVCQPPGSYGSVHGRHMAFHACHDLKVGSDLVTLRLPVKLHIFIKHLLISLNYLFQIGGFLLQLGAASFPKPTWVAWYVYMYNLEVKYG